MIGLPAGRYGCPPEFMWKPLLPTGTPTCFKVILREDRSPVELLRWPPPALGRASWQCVDGADEGFDF